MTINHRISFIKRPGVNAAPSVDCFGYEECPYPNSPQNGEVMIKTQYLSVDPALRCRMNESTGVAYMGPWGISETVTGAAGIGVVVKSSNENFKEGDTVQAQFGWPWLEYFTQAVDNNFQLQLVDSALVNGRVSLYLSVLSLTSGLTSYLGITEKGHIVEGADQTLVVSGAAGACGSLAGQIGRLKGCGKVVGICGTDEKCKFLTDTLGFDGAVNYKSQDISAELKRLCPAGVDVYFDNVGGDISNTVISQMNCGSHVILCGQIAVYNKDLPYPPPIPEHVHQTIKDKNITRERYLVLNYPDKFEAGMKQLAEWIIQGKLKVQETIEEGLMNAGKAFVSMMNGGNIGKQIVKVCD